MEIEEVEAEGPPWKPKHHGIPLAWKHKGDGGNANVWTDGTHAIKRLKPNASKEPVSRFTREAQLLAGIAGDSRLAIVPIIAVRKRMGEIEIVMELFDGSLAEVIGEFAGQPEKSASALLPVVETLARLAARGQPVHHRDVKPENLLYRKRDCSIELALSDFGCAYLAEDERLTPTHRAIGAWAYRPPEYSIGRVVAVDEKGDVFSLGKVLWAMINGERHVVFPGPVWFQDEFDLARKFPAVPRIHQAMIVVAQACHIRSDQRPTLGELAENLRHLISIEKEEATVGGAEQVSEMLRKEARRELEYNQRRSFSEQFVLAIHADFLLAINTIHSGVPRSVLFQEWFKITQKYGQSKDNLVNQVAYQESDAPVSNVFFQQTLLNTRFFPANRKAPICFVARVEDRSGQIAPSQLRVFGHSQSIQAELKYADGTEQYLPYHEKLMKDFLIKAAMHLP